MFLNYRFQNIINKRVSISAHKLVKQEKIIFSNLEKYKQKVLTFPHTFFSKDEKQHEEFYERVKKASCHIRNETIGDCGNNTQ